MKVQERDLLQQSYLHAYMDTSPVQSKRPREGFARADTCTHLRTRPRTRRCCGQQGAPALGRWDPATSDATSDAVPTRRPRHTVSTRARARLRPLGRVGFGDTRVVVQSYIFWRLGPQGQALKVGVWVWSSTPL